MRILAVLAAGLLLLPLAACSSPSTTTSASPSTASAPAPATAAVAATPAAQEVASTASGWFAGAELTLTKSVLDPDQGRATVTASARNTSNHDLELTGDVFLDLADGAAPAPLIGTGATAVKLSTSVVSLEFRVDRAADLSKAVLQLGDVDQQRWLVPLAAGATGAGTAPRTQTVTDAFTATGYAFRVSRIDVVPWGCAEVNVQDGVGTTDYGPVAKGKLGLLVWMTYTEQANYPGGDSIDQVSITQPDGTAVRADPRTVVQDHGDRVEDIPWCIAADEPVGGRYVLRWSTYETGSGSHTVTVR